MFRRSAVMTCIVITSIVVFSTVVQAEDNTVKLKEVVVTATKTEKQQQDVTQSVTVINAEEITKSGAGSVGELINLSTGATVNMQGPRGSLMQVKLRGSSSEQVLVLVDGTRMNSQRSGGFDLSDLAVPLDSIERIEIVRGPASALYGADAVGGVVNIITKKAAAPSTTISGAAGEHGYKELAIRNTGKQDGVYYTLNAGNEHSAGYRGNSRLEKQTGGLKLGYALGAESNIEAWTEYITRDIGVPGRKKPGTKQDPSSWNAGQFSRDFLTGVGYAGRISQAIDVKANASERKNKLNYTDPDSMTDSTHEIVSRSADMQVNVLAGSWNVLTVGGESRRDRLDSTSSGNHEATLEAAFIQDEISMGESVILVLGGRNDKHSVYGSKWSPKASGRYLLSSSGTIVRASYGKSFRAPTFNDLYWPYSSSTFGGIDYITEGNSGLKPETAEEYEGGLEQSLGKGNSVKVTGFRRKVKNLIQWYETITATTDQFQPRNIGSARISGYEAEAKFAFAETSLWTVNYTRLFPVDEATGERITTTASPMADMQLGSTFVTALDKHTVLALDGHWIKNYVQTNKPRWQYYTIDGKITDTVVARKDMKTDVFVGVKNMLNREYEVSKGYPMPKREVYGGLAFQF